MSSRNVLPRVINSYYTPDVPPQDITDLPSYTETELKKISLILNLLTEGLILPPTTSLPQRNLNGVVKLFVKDTDGNLPDGIHKEGIYIYYGGKWHKFGVTT